MELNLKPIEDQTIVVTGASSGIGLATALTAASHGANVVMVGRSGDTLTRAAAAINEHGGFALPVMADVGSSEEMRKVAEQATGAFGGIDTWVNNAGLGMYGRIEAIDEQDAKRLFDTNFWGVVNGSMAALPHLKAQGGTLINVGSEVSDAYMPLIGFYTASKHAVKGFTDTLRLELAREDAPVSVTLIQPTSVNTPFPNHARNYMDEEPKLPPPVIDPQQVADAILDAAQSPRRDVNVGMMASVNVATANLLPWVADMISKKRADQQKSDMPPRDPMGILYRPSESGLTHGIKAT